MTNNNECAKLRENIDIINKNLSELPMDNSYKQVNYTNGKTKVTLEFPIKQKHEKNTESIKQEIHSLLSAELQRQIQKIS